MKLEMVENDILVVKRSIETYLSNRKKKIRLASALSP